MRFKSQSMKSALSAKPVLIVTMVILISTTVFAAQTLGGPSTAGRYLALLSASGQVNTSSISFEDILDMTTVFTTRGKGSCITATFSGELFNVTGPGTFALRAVLDGALMEGHGSDGDVSHVNETGYPSLASYTFWKCDMRPGLHTVAMQWRVGGLSGQVGIDGRTLIIEGR